MSAWLAQTVSFKYRLGEHPLLQIKLPGAVRNASKEEPPIGTCDLPDLFGAPEHVRVLLVRSQPIASQNVPVKVAIGRWTRYCPYQFERYYIDLTITYEAYLKKFSAKSVSTIRRKIRKFAEFCGGGIHWRTYRTKEELIEFYQLARTISAKTYQETLLSAGLPEDEQFQLKMRNLAVRDELRAYLLFHKGKPVSYLYCPAQSGVLLYQYLGYDPAFAGHSVGTILQWLAVEQLFSEKVFTIFDFTEGEGDHKRFFATGSYRCADFYLLDRSLRSRLLIETHRASLRLSTAGAQALDRLGLKRHIKRALRRLRSR